MVTPLLIAAALQLAKPDAHTVVNTAMDRMGGKAQLMAIERVRYDFVTQWNLSLDPRPGHDRPTYERNVDVRDYRHGGWRNSREFTSGGATLRMVDLVRDDVAVRQNISGDVTPLNIAYVDERDEVFLYAPDRLLLLLSAAADLSLQPDTIVEGVRHARVAATLSRFPVRVLLRSSDGLPHILQFQAAHPNDFGLVPLGRMDVEVTYTGWQPVGRVHLPHQWDISRAGQPYKRLTVTHAVVNPQFAADSFAVSSSMREAFQATARKPMHDVPLDSACLIDRRFVEFRAFGAPAGAVRIGQAWVLLETGQAPLSAERAIGWMEVNGAAIPSLAIIGSLQRTNGGLAHVVRHRIRVITAPAFAALGRAILSGHEVGDGRFETLSQGRWLEVGGDSMRVEPLDLPDAPGGLLLFVPALRWIYAPNALTSLDLEIVLQHAHRSGWVVDRIGNARHLLLPKP